MGKGTMKAWVKAQRAPGAELQEVPIPTIQPAEVLLKVISTSVCGTDLHIYEWNEWAAQRIKTPQIMGHEVCGEVVEVGSEVHHVKPGEYISVETHIPCRICYQCRTGHFEICRNMKILGVDTNGAFAEYVAVPEIDVWKNNAAIPPLLAPVQEPLGNAIDTVLSEDIAGKTVSVIGCGPVGMLAIGVARVSGATTIFATDLNEYRLSIARQMGATHVFNPQRHDVIGEITEATHGDGVDVVLEMSGNAKAFNQGLKALTFGGRVSMLGLHGRAVELDLNNDVILKGVRLYGVTGRRMFSTWYKAARFIKSGVLDIRPVITHQLPLSEFQKGMELMASGNCGKVVFFA